MAGSKRIAIAGLAGLIVALCPMAGRGQTTANGPILNAVPASYVIGPNDVLAMKVFGADELSDAAMRVDSDGTIHTPYGNTPVRVGGMTIDKVRTAIAAELVKDQLAVDPKVEVSVVDPESHPITISGLGVKQPGTVQAIQPMRLVEALNRAGGLADNSGAEIVVIAPGANGSRVEKHYSAAAVLSGADASANPWLQGGEEVRVMPGGFAYLSGAVQTQGAYALSDTDPLTIRKAMTKAHGLAPAAKADQAELVRHAGTPEQTVTRINLPAIMNGTAPDVALAANDMVYVPVSGSKKASLDALSRTLSVLTVAASTLLVR